MHYQLERNYGCRVSDSWTYRGLKTAVLENELLRVVVLIDKGADIYQLVHKPTDVDFMLRTPWGARDPTKFTPTTGSATGSFADVYEGGWQTVLPGGGFPSVYRGADLGLHAEVSTMPWDCTIIEDTPQRVSIRCWVRTYRTPFFFEKTLTLTGDSPVLAIEEALVNEGEEPVHCVWGEHIALGAPFLSDDCVIDLPGGRVINHPVEWDASNRLKAGFDGPWPWSETKDGGRVDLSKVPPRSIRAHDQTYIADMPEGWYAITNQRMRLGFGVVFPKELFRYLWYWQSFGGAFGYPFYGRGYSVGLEPFTSYTNDGLEAAIERGTALLTQPRTAGGSFVESRCFANAQGVERIQPDGSVIARG